MQSKRNIIQLGNPPKWKIPPVPEPIRLKELVNLACTSTKKSVKWVTEIKPMFWTKRKSEGGTGLVSLWQKIKYMTISLRYSLKWTELEEYHLIKSMMPLRHHCAQECIRNITIWRRQWWISWDSDFCLRGHT